MYCSTPAAQLICPAAIPGKDEVIDDADDLGIMPEELILSIFDQLAVNELASCKLVSRRWLRLASDAALWQKFDIKEIFSFVNTFDASQWHQNFGDLAGFGLSFDEEPPLASSFLLPIVRKYLSSLPKDETPGLTILTIPKGNITLENLKVLKPLTDKVNKSYWLCKPLLTPIEPLEVERTYRIVITNDVYKQSLHLSAEEQKQFLGSLKCQMPKLMEAALHIIALTSLGKSLHSGGNSLTVTRCEETFFKQHMVVGHSHQGDPVISVHDNLGSNSDGVLAILEKLSSP